MSLAKYNEKRHFNETPEPKGTAGKKGKKLIFVVQRHQASHLHYDFRLEMDGVLKSWAVPKGPSLNPKDKRLAMMVEDHPVSYATFAGTIPKGNYGAGIVEVWDHGTYTLSPDNKSTGEEAIGNGSLKIILHGAKLQGQFALVKLKNAEANAWLLIKDKDEHAVSKPYNSEDYTNKNSSAGKALTGRKATAVTAEAAGTTKSVKRDEAFKKKRQFPTP